MKPKIKIELRQITPEIAQEMLSRNVVNRPLRQPIVDKYAELLRSDAWPINGDTITFSDRGLVDGQHRLTAIVQTGICLWMIVVEGVDHAAFDTKDCGLRRTSGDTLAVRGALNGRRLAAALAVLDRYMTGRLELKVEYTNRQITELAKTYPDLERSLSKTLPRRLLPLSVYDACVYLFEQRDPALAEEFVQKLHTGAGLQPGAPWHALRERLVANNAARAKMPKEYLMALCIKAWNAARVGASVTCLKWQDTGRGAEAFPKVR
jgi:hypothetical protein